MYKYGMRFSSIRYWQNRARDLWRYNSIVILPMIDHKASAQIIGHHAIMAATIVRPDRLRKLLETGK